MADYLITWVDYATDQYLTLDPDVRIHLDEPLRRLAHDPAGNAHYDRTADR